ncbi:transcription factor HES-5-like [Pelodytes ibericus]
MQSTFHMLQEAAKPQINSLKNPKMRKPVIEKMRRDRINSSIDQLRILLETEIQTHHPHSKLEKADILEMTVSYVQRLRQLRVYDTQLSPKNGQYFYYQGYSRCLRESRSFLCNREDSQNRQEETSNHQTVSLMSPPHPCTKSVWRPW